MKQFILLILTILLILSGCKKENFFPNITVSGNVKDSTTNQNIENVEVNLYRIEFKGLLFSQQVITNISSTFTDENGNWQLEFRPDKDKDYYISFSKSEFYKNTVSYDKLEPSANQILLAPKGYIKVLLSDDYLSDYNIVNVVIVNSYNIDCCIFASTETIDNPYYFNAVGNCYNKIEWTLFYVPEKSPKEEYFCDSIFVNSNDTAKYFIKI